MPKFTQQSCDTSRDLSGQDTWTSTKCYSQGPLVGEPLTLEDRSAEGHVHTFSCVCCFCPALILRHIPTCGMLPAQGTFPPEERPKFNFKPRHCGGANLSHWDSGNPASDASQLGNRGVALRWPRGISGPHFPEGEDKSSDPPKSPPMLRLHNNPHLLWRKPPGSEPWAGSRSPVQQAFPAPGRLSGPAPRRRHGHVVHPLSH